MVFMKNEITVKKILWLQWTAGIATMLTTFSVGLMMGWTSPFLAKLTSGEATLTITAEEASWVASFLNLGRLFGAVIGGISVGYFGSKHTLTMLGLPLLLCFTCTIVADAVIWLYIARFAAGISMGMAYCSFPLFLGEVASPRIRGSMVSLAITGMALGNFTGNVMGAYLSLPTFSSIGLVPNIIFILLFLWLPQSPHYLVRLTRIEDAKNAIARYNPEVDSKVEVESLQNFMSYSTSMTFRDKLREFNIPQNRRSGIITLALYIFIQFSGANSVVFYQEIILTNAKVTIIPPATAVIMMSAVGVMSGWISIAIADKFERKALMIVGSIGVAISMCAIGTQFALLHAGFDPEVLQFVPIIAMMLLAIAAMSSLASVPSMLISELFAPNIKALASCFGSIAVGSFGFIATKSFQPLISLIGESYFFWLNACLMILCAIFCAIFMPQTKGKTLQEIQDAAMSK